MSAPQFNFDFWVTAFKEDPEGYDELAKAYIHQVIDEMDRTEEEKNKLRGLYWKCVNDPAIRNIQNPYVRASKASTLMWEKFHELNDLLQELRGTANANK